MVKMNKKTLFIILFVITLLVALVVIIGLKNKPKSKANYSPANVMNSEEIKKGLKIAMKSCEDAYQEAKAITEGYDRNAFYNNSRLEMTYYDGEVEFVNQEDIYVNTEKVFLDAQGNTRTSLPELTYKGEVVSISNYYKIETNHYYLIRYQKAEDVYAYYFVGKMSSNGFEDFDLYCVIEEDNSHMEDSILELSSDSEFEEF